MKTSISLILITLLSFSTKATSTSTSISKDQQSFKSKEFIHTNIGCPMNSTCNKETGAIYKQWAKLLRKTNKNHNQVSTLNKLAKEVGFPFSSWVSSTSKLTDKLIIWDSHCRNHNIDGREKIHIGLQFINNTSEAKQLSKLGHTYNRFMLTQEKSGEIGERIVPRMDPPLYFDGQNLIYQMELEGNYFSQSLSKSGRFKIVKSYTPKDFPRTITCSQNLLKAASSKELTKDLYLGFFCQEIWDKKSGLKKTILLPWSCN